MCTSDDGSAFTYATGMAGGGAHGRASANQRRALAHLQEHFLGPAISAAWSTDPRAPLHLVDYGSADCLNSVPIYEATLAAADAAGLPRSRVLISAVDVPGNCWDTACAACVGLGLFTRQLLPTEATRAELLAVPVDDASGRAHLVPVSFYERAVPDGSVHVGIVANSVHWLSREVINKYSLSLTSGSLFARCASPEEQRRFADAAEEDGIAFLRHRAAELRPGGRLLMVNGAFDEATGDFTYRRLWGVLGDLLRRFGACATMPIYPRTASDWERLLEAPCLAGKLRLVTPPLVIHARNLYFSRHFAEGGGGPEADEKARRAFAEDYAASVWAWGGRLFFDALENDRGREEAFLEALRERLAENPREFEVDFVDMFLVMERAKEHQPCS